MRAMTQFREWRGLLATSALLPFMICAALSISAVATTFGGFAVSPSLIVGKRARVLATGDFNGDGLPDIAVAGLGSNQINVLLSCSSGTLHCVNGFLPAVNYAIGTPSSVVVADVNGDGILDLIASSAAGNSLTLFEGKAGGTFVNARCQTNSGLCQTGAGPTAMAVGNFRGHAKEVDLVVVNSTAGTISVLLGNGTNFIPPTTYTVGPNPTSAAIADVNGDGFPDIVVTNGGNNTITVLLGSGTGTFTAATPSPTTDAIPVSVAIADFNGDGIPDLAVAASVGNTVDILLGVGNGTFQAPTQVSAGANPQTVAVADFRNNGENDLVVADGAGNNVTVLLGNGNGTFQPGVQYASGAKTVAAVVADMTGNGNLDIVVSNADLVPGQVTIISGNGNGTFQGGINYGVGQNPQGIVSADFNCNGIADLAVADAGSNSVELLLGSGNGTFTPSGTLTTDVHPVAIVTADFNQDGVPDLAVVNSATGDVTVFLGTSGCTGSFNVPVNYSLGSGINGVSLATADFNNDGYPDLVIANLGNGPGTGSVITLLNNKDGTFGAPIVSYPGTNPNFVAAGNFNNNKNQDVVVANQDAGSVSVLSGNGAGSFTLVSTTCVGVTPCAGVPVAIAVGNFNGTANTDIAVANYDDTSVTILLGKGNGTFSSKTYYDVGANPLSIVAAPIQGNAMQEDLVVANSENDTISVLLNQLNGKGGFKGGLVNIFPTGESPASVAVADFNGDGLLDVACANQSSNNVTILGQN